MSRINVNIPSWLRVLPAESKIISDIIDSVKSASNNVTKMKDFTCLSKAFDGSEDFNELSLNELRLGNGTADYTLKANEGLFYKVLSEESGEKIDNDYELMSFIKGFATERRKYDKIKSALIEAEESGYGVVMPTLEEMSLEAPVLVKKKGGYGVKLKATAPSLHIMKVDVSTEVSPIVGNQKQGEDMVNYIVSKYEEGQAGVLETNMFGKSLSDIVSDGLSGKANGMGSDTKAKMRRTVTRIVNEGRGGVICILL